MDTLRPGLAGSVAPRNVEQSSGLLLVLVWAGAVVFMALHPQMHGHNTAGLLQDIAGGAGFNVAVHGILMGLIALAFLGLWGFAQSRGLHRMPVRCGLVAFGLGTVSLIGAGAINGIVLSNIALRYAGKDAPTTDSVRPILALCMEANHACDFIGIFGLSAAIGCWSFSLWRDGEARPAVLGLIAGLGAPVLLAIGKLPMTVHGFGAFVLAQAAWMIWIGYRMWRGTLAPPRS